MEGQVPGSSLAIADVDLQRCQSSASPCDYARVCVPKEAMESNLFLVTTQNLLISTSLDCKSPKVAP
eukprot:m.296506 g.296506  ORF g.296506 m.296506 type:complete len:67 (+) comp70856_c0_seq1:190-390(+)